MDVIIPLCNLIPDSLTERIVSINFAFHQMYKNDLATGKVYFVEQTLDGKSHYLHRLPNHDKVEKILIRHKVFNKAWCMNIAAKKSNAQFLALSDCDMYQPNYSAYKIQSWMQAHNHKWAFGWNKIHYTTQKSKDVIFTDGTPNPLDNQVSDRHAIPTPGYSEGGIVIVKREFFIKIGMCNECMQNLGGPDNELALRLRKATNNYPSYPAIIYHLWHPTDGKKSLWRGPKNLIILKYTNANPAKANRWLAAQNQGDLIGPLAASKEFLS